MLAIGPGSMGRPACETTSERVIPVTARAGAEPAEGPKEGAKASSASGLRTIGWAPLGAIPTGCMTTFLETAGALVIVGFRVVL